MKKTRIIALLTAGLMLLSGCNNAKNQGESKDVAIKVGDISVTTGDIAVLADLSSSQYGELSKDDFAYQAKLVKDVLEKAELAKAMDIEFTEDDKNSAIAIRANFAQSNGGYKEFEKYLTDNGSSVESLDAIFTASVYATRVQEKISKEFEGKEPTDEELKKFYEESYLRAKHILVLKDDEGAAEGEKQGEELAKDLLDRAKAGEDFDALIAEYSQDPGSETNPDGYVFTDGEMVEPFENKVKELKVGEFGICESDYGYHVILRVELPAFDEQKDSVALSYPAKRIENRIAELLKEHKIKSEVNQELIDAITVDSIKKKAVDETADMVQ